MADEPTNVPHPGIGQASTQDASAGDGIEAADASLGGTLRHHLGDVVRYLYFMRFSLLLWLSMVALAEIDCVPAAASITRGILTPFSPWQWFFTGFSVVLPGWVALLAARIVCAYGKERFGALVPPVFCIHNRMDWFVFWGAQLPGLGLLVRIAFNVVHEGEGGYFKVYVCLLAGASAALFFWYMVAILYYWIWDPDSTIPVRAFLVPRWRLLPLEEIENLSCESSLRFFSRPLGLLRLVGPGYELQGRVAPGHVVAAIALYCAIVLYLLLMAVSAPVPVPKLAWAGRLLALALAVYVLFSLLAPSCRGLFRGKSSLWARWLPVLSSLVMLLLLLIAAAQLPSPRVLPVIAYVVMLLMIVFWTLAGTAFFADRFRVPVLTSAIMVVMALNHWPAEHVFPAEPIDASVTHERLRDPADFVRRIAFRDAEDAQPVIIVTATGGGIHAAAWTATVLSALDHEFGDLQFHQHILLMSTVSGGSVATAGFLREYFADPSFDAASYRRVQQAASCSSLQAVAWGLAYPDSLRLFFPWFFNAFPSVDRFDRGWALQQAVDRNIHDPECQTVPEAQGPKLSNLTLNALSRLEPHAAPCAGHEEACLHFPAFTFNTTVVETGDRFLLSNYSVFAGNSGTDVVLPAASFLGVYGRETILPLPHPRDVPERGGFADLSLLTAARLSASFTYVSPAARLPFEDSQGKTKNAYHFVDGGYYDNDGTNSAIEFLEAASPAFSPKHPLRVLLIEIRNTDDIDANDSPDAYAYQSGLQWKDGQWVPGERSGKRRFGPLDQVAAPPEAAIAAGFSSVTRRNRRELDTLESALCGSLEVNHVVIDYQQEIVRKAGSTEVDTDESEVDQPLSWHLTRRQQNWIEGESDNALDRKKPLSDRGKIRAAVDWFKQAQRESRGPLDLSDTCKAQFLLQDEGKAR